MIEEIISHYRLDEKISGGSMGVIFRARDLHLDRTVALKFISGNYSDMQESRERFTTEAKALALLNHPNIATIYGIEKFEDKLFIVMEFIEGTDLRKFMSSANFKDLPLTRVLALFSQILCGLKAAHNKGVIHRDLKPENIMIDPEGNVKILDFGLAKTKGTDMLTRIGTTMGTAAYMSPEQSRGEPVDHRTDIWSAGVILYEMLSLERPFKGDYEQAVIYSILHENPKPLHLIDSDVTDILNRIIKKTLQRDPDERYQDCGQLLEDVRSAVDIYSGKGVLKEIPPTNQPAEHPGYSLSFKQLFSRKIVFTLVILAAIIIYLVIPQQKFSTEAKKIAVLPFLNLTNNQDDEYFSDGMMDDILTQLVKIGGLKVISRTTMMTYRNSPKTLKEISGELNADVVLEGSVRRSADELRITVQLINAASDEHLWAETYDTQLNKVLVVQSEIASKIAEALYTELSPAEKERLVPADLKNPAAYNLLLQGSYYFSKGSRSDVEKAIEYFISAISIEESNARAWAKLATAYARQADIGAVSTEEGYSKARHAAQNALRYDNQLALGYTILGWIKRSYDWDWLGAEKECRKALELAPGDINVIRNMANMQKSLGKFSEAIELMERAVELDPRQVTIYTSLGFLSMYANQLDKAAAAYRKAIELNPTYSPAHTYLGLVYLLDGRTDEAIRTIREETDDGWKYYGLAHAYYSAGKISQSDSVLKMLIKEYGDDSAYQIAAAYAYRGDNDMAFQWLEKAYEQRDGGLSEIIGDPFMKNLETDPRYKNFLKKMNLPF